jgi:hypothetical protein
VSLIAIPNISPQYQIRLPNTKLVSPIPNLSPQYQIGLPNTKKKDGAFGAPETNLKPHKKNIAKTEVFCVRVESKATTIPKPQNEK